MHCAVFQKKRNTSGIDLRCANEERPGTRWTTRVNPRGEVFLGNLICKFIYNSR